MELAEVIAYLKANNGSAAMIAYLEGLKTVNNDSVKDYLEKDESGKKLLQSFTDTQVTKGINTFKEKTMPGLIEEEIKKKFPDETEEQKKTRTLEDNLKKLESEIKRKDMLNKAMSIATEKKLPLKIVERFLGEDEESTLKNIELLESEYSGAITKAVEAKFAESGRGTPPNNPPLVDYSKMTDEQYYAKRQIEQSK